MMQCSSCWLLFEEFGFAFVVTERQYDRFEIDGASFVMNGSTVQIH
jgi:hypothetical protein